MTPPTVRLCPDLPRASLLASTLVAEEVTLANASALVADGAGGRLMVENGFSTVQLMGSVAQLPSTVCLSSPSRTALLDRGGATALAINPGGQWPAVDLGVRVSVGNAAALALDGPAGGAVLRVNPDGAFAGGVDLGGLAAIPNRTLVDGVQIWNVARGTTGGRVLHLNPSQSWGQLHLGNVAAISGRLRWC